MDHHDAILEADESFSQLVDRLPESLPGLHFYQLVFPDDRPSEQDLFRELLEGKRTRYRHRLRLMRGRATVWVNVSVARLPASEGGSRLVRAVQEASRLEELVGY